MEILDIVDLNDEVIGQAPRGEVEKKLLCHRIVHVLVFDDQNRLALQLSGRNKAFSPRHWGTSAGGHVKAGESYEQAALRELEEELGIKAKIDFFRKDYFENTWGYPKFLTTFTTTHNGPFQISPEELESIGFFELAEIQKMIDQGEKFHPELLFLLEKHYGLNRRSLGVIPPPASRSG